MGLIGSSDTKCSVNASLPENVIERIHYQAKHSRQKRAFANGGLPVSVSVGYDGDKLDEKQVDLVENYLAYKLYDDVPRSYFETE
jgi:hypothetical protein